MTDSAEPLREAQEFVSRHASIWHVEALMASFAEQAREERTQEIVRDLRLRIDNLRKLPTMERDYQYVDQADILEAVAEELERTYLKK
jgi:two-component sensor histidine kinase